MLNVIVLVGLSVRVQHILIVTLWDRVPEVLCIGQQMRWVITHHLAQDNMSWNFVIVVVLIVVVLLVVFYQILK